MNSIIFLMALASSSSEAVEASALPPEVVAFVAERDVCEHFRGEPTEGSSPEQVERREFVRGSIDIYCAGTDRRLAALRTRYSKDPAVLNRLGEYETSIEPSCD